MRKQALSALIVCLCAGALSAGFSLGRPAAVKKRVDRLDDKVVAFQAAKASPNRAPVISGITALPATVAVGGRVLLSVSASDPDGDALSYVWTSTAGAVIGLSTSASLNWVSPSTAGVYAVTCTVADGKGNSSVRAASTTAVPTGTKKWEFNALGAINASPAVGADGTIYVAADNGKLYAVNPDGTKKWEYATSPAAAIKSSPALGADGNIYFGDAIGNFYSVSASTGGFNWVYSVPGAFAINSSPAIGSDGTLYFGADDGQVYVLDPSLGIVKNVNPLGGSTNLIAASPVIDAYGTVYVGAGEGNIYALAADGSNKWVTSFPAGGPFTSSPAIGADGVLYAGNDDGGLYATNISDGLPRSMWTFTFLTNPIQSSPAIGADGTIYFGAGDGSFYAVNSADGSAKWAGPFVTGGPVSASPAIGADGTVYVGSEDNSLYAVDPDGAARVGAWPFATSGPIKASPAIGTDGTVYVGSNDGRLYAVYGNTPLASSPWPKFRRDTGNTGR